MPKNVMKVPMIKSGNTTRRGRVRANADSAAGGVSTKAAAGCGGNNLPCRRCDRLCEFKSFRFHAQEHGNAPHQDWYGEEDS